MSKKLAVALSEGYKINKIAESENEFQKKEDELEKQSANPEAEMEEEEEVSPESLEDEIDTDDAQLLAVVNVYFKKINKKSPAVQADKLEKLCHRLINSMIEMPRGEKEARNALKLAIKEINN